MSLNILYIVAHMLLGSAKKRINKSGFQNCPKNHSPSVARVSSEHTRREMTPGVQEEYEQDLSRQHLGNSDAMETVGGADMQCFEGVRVEA